jgi:outer membrane lipoprotein-sorting protein
MNNRPPVEKWSLLTQQSERFIRFAGVLCVTLMLGACFDPKTPLPENPAEAVTLALQKQIEAAPFRLVQSVTIGGETTEQILEYVPPDRFHMRSAGGESIMIGGDWYLRVGDRWTKMMALFSGADSPMGFSTDAVFNAEVDGEETLRGERVRRYTYQAPSTTAAAGELDQTTLWVRLEDALPVQMEAANANSVTRSSIEYDAAIQIEAPDIAP